MSKEKNIESENNKLTRYLSIGLCLLFLIFGVILFIKILIIENRQITQPEVYLILGLFALAVLIFSFKEIFQGIIRKRVEDYLSEEQIKKMIDSSFEDQISERISEAIDSGEREKEIAEETEERKDDSLDTLVVPSGLTQHWIKKYEVYFYPQKRKFKETEFIAFYANKKIWMVGKRVVFDKQNISEIFSEEKIKEFELEFGPIKDHSFIKIVSPEHLKVPHVHSNAFVQNRRYVNHQKLLIAKATDYLT